MTRVKIVKGKEKAVLPERKSEEAAGYDVYACLEKEVFLKQGERIGVPTGLYLEIPSGYFVSIRPRSSLALKFGVTLANSPGTIDSDYRGELKVLLVNLGKEGFVIRHGDRIAQMMLERFLPVDFQEVDTLSDTKRAEGGFGSTGP